MLIVTVNIYMRSQLAPNDPLFLFISTNSVLNILLILLACLVVAVSFTSRFKNWYFYAACSGLAVFLCLIGVISLFSSNIDYWLSGLLLPLDSMLVLEAGIILAVCSLSYKHANRPAMPKLAELSGRIRRAAFPVLGPTPKSSQSGPRRIQPA